MRGFASHRQYTWLPWLVIGMGLLTVATAALGLHYVERRLVAARGESLAFAASEIADKLDLLLAEEYDDTLELARTQVFRKGGLASQSAYLATIKTTHPTYLWLGVTDAGGRIVAATDPASIGQDRSRSDWFQAARDIDGVHMSAAQPFEETGGVDAISFTTSIKGANGKLQGVLTTRVGLPALEEVLTRSIQTFGRREEFAGSIEYQFMNAEGYAFIDSDLLHKGNVNLKQLGVLSALLSESGQPGYVAEPHKRRHVPVVTGYAQTRGFDKPRSPKWTILLRMDQSALLAPIRKVLWTLGAVSLLIGGPLFIMLVWSTTRLKKEWILAKEEHTRAARAEANYSALLESTGEGVCGMDRDGHLTFINRAGATKLRYRPDELLGKRVHVILHHSHPDSSLYPLDQCPITRTIRSGQSCILEHEMLWRKDGTSFPAKYSAYPIQEEGVVNGAVVIFSDVTEKDVAEENLKKSERFLHQAQQIARLGSWHWDILPNEVTWSHHLYQLFGLSPGTPVTFEVFLALVHPEDHASVQSAVESSLRNDTPFDIEYRAVRPDGAFWWVHARGETIRDSAGTPVAMVGVAQDITERKQAEDQLRRNEQRFRAILDGALDAVISTDERGAITDWNPRAEAIFGWSRSEAIGQNLADTIISSQYRMRHKQGLKRYLDTGETSVLNRRIQITALRRDGTEFPVELTISALKDETGHRFTAFLADITERKQAEEVQKKLVSELAESRNRFETFFRKTPSAIAITTIKEGRFLDLNQQAEILTGYTREELIGRTTVEMNLYVDPTDRPGLVQALRQKGMLTDLEREIRTKSGEIRTAVFSLVPIQMGSEPCLLSIAHDITERKQAEQRLHERSRQQAIEAELSLLAVTIQDLPNLLSTAAGLVSNALEMHYCEVLELIPNGTDLRLCASAGWRGDQIGNVRALETGSMAQASLNSSKPVVRTLQEDSRFGGPQWLHEHGAVTAMSVSIPGKDGPWGVLGVYTAVARAFSRDDVNFLQTVSSILATAIDRMQTENVLRGANQSLRLLSRQLLQVQEDDRRAIARDLHDEIGQSLTAIKLNVERAQRMSDRDVSTRIMQDCAQITEHVLGQVRNLSLDLHPSILDDLGLPYALKWYADRQAERAGLKVDMTADPSLPRLPPDIEIACFRIAQEALTNVIRHARANLAGIILKQGPTEVQLYIRDDGIGFVVDRAAPANGRSSVGLTSMQERARLLGGTVKVTSAPLCGTTVMATLPLPVVSPAGLPTEEVPDS